MQQIYILYRGTWLVKETGAISGRDRSRGEEWLPPAFFSHFFVLRILRLCQVFAPPAYDRSCMGWSGHETVVKKGGREAEWVAANLRRARRKLNDAEKKEKRGGVCLRPLFRVSVAYLLLVGLNVRSINLLFVFLLGGWTSFFYILYIVLNSHVLQTNGRLAGHLMCCSRLDGPGKQRCLVAE